MSDQNDKLNRDRIAVIDVGTSSMKVLIGGPDSFTSEGFRFPHFKAPHGASEGMLTGLGRALDGAGDLRIPLLQDVRMGLLRYGHEAERYGCRREEIVTFGTGALRGARNRAEVIDWLHRETGIRVRILTGQQEATYAWLAARMSHPQAAGATIVSIDQGGGTTDIAVGAERDDALDLVAWASLPLGVTALQQSLAERHPNASLEAAGELAYEHARRVIRADFPLPTLDPTRPLFVVAAGSCTSALCSGNQAERHGKRMDVERMSEIVHTRYLTRYAAHGLAEVTSVARSGGKDADAANKCLAAVLGTPILRAVLESVGADTFRATGAGLRYGVWFAAVLGWLELAEEAAAK